jgi:hypothetical protein
MPGFTHGIAASPSMVYAPDDAATVVTIDPGL